MFNSGEHVQERHLRDDVGPQIRAHRVDRAHQPDAGRVAVRDDAAAAGVVAGDEPLGAGDKVSEVFFLAVLEHRAPPRAWAMA